MGEHANELGVDIFPGTPGASFIYGDDGSVHGVVSGDFGISKSGKMK
jgi:electron-transferring-flavoprotein dehydrogenase